MKSIKFRVWNKRYSDLEYVDDLYWFEENFCHKIEDDEREFQFSTGLVDKFGQLIYDGDVVLVKKDWFWAFDHKALVRHINEPRMLGWHFSNRHGCWTLTQEAADQLQVLGNKYENPYLLDCQ